MGVNMTDNVQAIIDKILESDKITAPELEKKIEEKLSALGGLISKEGAAHIVANELEIQINQTPSADVKLKDVLPGMKNVTVLVKVLKKYEIRTFGADGQGKVASLFVGDDTGFMRITFWNEKTTYHEAINEGDVIEIQHAYSKENNDRVDIHMRNASHCVVNPEGKTVEVKKREQQEINEKKLGDIADIDTFINITATIVQAYDPRFFESCPECKKRMTQEGEEFVCAEHGKKVPTYNYVMNVFLDDGSANMRASLWKEQIQSLLGKTDEEIIALKDNTEQLEEIKTDLLGRIISARARVKLNEAYNTKELVLYEVNANPKPNVEAQGIKLPVAENASEQSEAPKTTPAPAESKPSNVSEEVMESSNEELMSIDDIGDDL